MHGSGARTAVAQRCGVEGDVVLGACTFIPHVSAGLCELQLLAVRCVPRPRFLRPPSFSFSLLL